MKELSTRLKKINHLKSIVDSIVLVNSENLADPSFTYFTNSTVPGVFYYDFSEPVIYVDKMYMEEIKSSWIKNIKELKNSSDAINTFSKNKILGINTDFITAKTFLKLKKHRYKNIGIFLDKIRTIKTRYEIKAIKKSCKLTKKVFFKFFNEIDNKKTESELRAVIEYYIKKFGAEPSFPPIVASGKNIAEPHHRASNKRLKETILVDFGVRLNNYCSDVTRTFGSKYKNIIQEVYNGILPEIKPHVKINYIYKKALKFFGKYKKYFITSLGHGIGIAVHENPNISIKNTDNFEEGMVFTIEPGLYLKNGIRVENDFLLTKNGAVNLTDF